MCLMPLIHAKHVLLTRRRRGGRRRPSRTAGVTESGVTQQRSTAATAAATTTTVANGATLQNGRQCVDCTGGRAPTGGGTKRHAAQGTKVPTENATSNVAARTPYSHPVDGHAVAQTPARRRWNATPPPQHLEFRHAPEALADPKVKHVPKVAKPLDEEWVLGRTAVDRRRPEGQSARRCFASHLQGGRSKLPLDQVIVDEGPQ